MRRESNQRPDLSKLSEQQLDYIADFMKERIYATITLLAVIAILWEGAGHYTPGKAALSILATALALWLASSISTQMSYKVAHGKIMPRRQFISNEVKHAVLLLSAFFPLLLVGVSSLGFISLKLALFVAMITSIGSLFLWSIRAGRSMHSSFKVILVVGCLETLVGLGVVALKIFAEQ